MLMAVMMPREKLTDERLDDLNQKVDAGFARVEAKIDEGIRGLRGDMKELRGDMKELRGDMKDLQRELNDRLESMNNRLVGGLFIFIAALIGSNAF